MNKDNYFAFEDCVKKIFCEAGYKIVDNNQTENARKIDLMIEKDGIKYCVEVKGTSVVREAVRQIHNWGKVCEMKPILVAACVLDDKRRRQYEDEYPEIILVDISNLLFAVKDTPELKNELVGVLPYVIDDIEPKQGFLQIDNLFHNEYTSSLIKELELCRAGRETFSKYEELCCKLLENIFSEDLTLWQTQPKSNNDLYRFDLICRIKDGNQKTFWSILEKYFNSKYVIFEFKNYNKAISQKEVYTTEKYLYAKALRSVGIVIAANGFDENAQWAAKGCLRENGKLIILLETNDLIKMNEMKLEYDDPSDYLLKKLDEILVELEK